MSLLSYILISLLFTPIFSNPSPFSINSTNFLYNGEPIQIRAGEIHYPRIAPEYWRHRIQMVKSMGLNAISTYTFWNLHQPRPDYFDFDSPEINLKSFLQIAKEEDMFVLIRPGPFIDAEWDAGGLPWWLLKERDIKVRSSDPVFMKYVQQYFEKLSEIIKEYQISQNGTIILLQIENEYGSFGNDREYVNALVSIWKNLQIEIPFYTADSALISALTDGTVDGAAIGLNPGVKEASFDLAENFFAKGKRPIFSSETYSGWLTHWGEDWQGKNITTFYAECDFLLSMNKSFSFYMVHGGSNWGFYAGSDYDEIHGFQSTISSYDYDAPINEQGAATLKFEVFRSLLKKYNPWIILPDPPAPIRTIEFEPITTTFWASLWENLPPKKEILQPVSMEILDQGFGLILYRTELRGELNGTLEIQDLHDFGNIYVNEALIGTMDRMKGEKTLQIKEEGNSLEILVEALGRVDFGPEIFDFKGISKPVTLNQVTLMHWEAFNLPLDSEFFKNIRVFENKDVSNLKEGIFFNASFNLKEVGDTYIDVSEWNRGFLWVNGKHLGRFSSVGPQKRLFCPGTWLKKIGNDVLVFDFFSKEPKTIFGKQSLKESFSHVFK